MKSNKEIAEALDMSVVYSLPIRNWNIFSQVVGAFVLSVYSLPIRNWNESLTRKSNRGSEVYSLPIRNWNIAVVTLSSPYIFSL